MQPLAAPAVGGPWADESAAPTRAGMDGRTDAEAVAEAQEAAGDTLGVRRGHGPPATAQPCGHQLTAGEGAAPPFAAPHHPG